MEAIKIAVPQTVTLPAKPIVATAQDQAMFASLLESLSGEAELPAEEQAPEKELLESLESLLALLQELPTGKQLPEAQDFQYAVYQLANLQIENGEIRIPSTSKSGETSEPITDGTGKLIGLLEKIQQNLQILSAEFTTEFAGSVVFTGADGKKNAINANTLEKISTQLDNVISILEKQQQLMSVQQSKIDGQELAVLPPIEGMKPVREALKYSNEITKPVEDVSTKPVDIQQIPQKNEAKEVQSAIKQQPTDELQTKVPAENKAPQEPAVQPTAAVESGKTAGAVVRTETNPPTPFVRLANLLEDLGGMLKSSMRLMESQEGMKMRVNIFPEHLGHLEILLTSTNGKLAAQILASTPMAKEAIELQLNQLRASLVQQGVAVEKIEVLQQSSQQPFNQQHSQNNQRFTQPQQGQGSSGNSKNGYLKEDDNVVAERRQSLGEGLMKVDYTV